MLTNQQIIDRLVPPTKPVNVILDTDTYNEVDDQFALTYAAASTEKINLIGVNAAPFLNARVSTEGQGMERSYQEIETILNLIHKDIPRYKGSAEFMGKETHPVESEAAANIIEQAMKAPDDDPLYVVAIGAPTNVASAILAEPRIIDKMVVVWMGGQPFYWPQTWEFNLMQDIRSTQTLFDSGVPLTVLPGMTVCSGLVTTSLELDAHIKGKNEIGTYLADTVDNFSGDAEDFASYNAIVNRYLDGIDDFDMSAFDTSFHPEKHAWSKIIWDPATIAYLVNPSWVYSKTVPAPVLNDDFTWGKREYAHPVRVAYYLNRDAIFGDMFYKIANLK